MIYSETIDINGRTFIRTWSDTYMIERDGAVYTEAIDPEGTNRRYVETGVLLPEDEPSNVDGGDDV